MAVAREADVDAAIAAGVRRLSPEGKREVLAFLESLTGEGTQQPEGSQRNGSQPDETLIATYIDTANVDQDHPSYARLANYGTPVWAVIGAWKACGDVAEVAREWEVPIDYVRAAIAYYRRYRRYIDALLVLNESAPHEPRQDGGSASAR